MKALYLLLAAVALTANATALAAGQLFQVTYPPSTATNELRLGVTYTLWMPAGVKTLRGVIVHQHGCGTGACQGGATAAYDWHWQSLARKWDCALLAPSYQQDDKQDCNLWCDPRNGSAKTFLRALNEFSANSGHTELDHVPWCLWGHSGGGFWASLMQTMYAERIVAIWLRSGTSFGRWERGEIPKPEIPDTAYAIPVMLNPGIKEKDEARFGRIWSDCLAMFRAYRAQDAPIGFAPDPRTGHECGDSRYLAIPFFDACLAQRLPPSPQQKLRPMNELLACAAPLQGQTAQPVASFQGDLKGSVWLPDVRFARAWEQYVKTGAVNDETPPPAPKDVRAVREPDGTVELTWEAEADFESGLGGFIIHREGKELAELPEKPVSRFGRPLFQTMSYHDTPEKPIPSPRFVDKAAEPGLMPSYHLVAVNSVGLKSEPTPAHPLAVTPRLKRANSFLGIHFDFHAGDDCKEIGKNTTPEMVVDILDQVRPDYIQVDCKGHRGLSSYPTLVGHPAPGFIGDPLRVWREVTAQHGVGLFMHYSGVWDTEAGRRHPDWAVRNADGTTNERANSVFGPYADALLIPQLKELAGVYRVDGAWVDGDCWATVPDYGERAQKLFRERTGFDAPHGPNDAHWFEWRQFHREGFREYLRHYVGAVKKAYPDFELCSNWAFSDHMPEPVSAPLDFLSGDFSPNDSVNSARLSARCLASQGKPWDLMSWSFAQGGGKPRRQKSAPQLQREAAVVLALGGGYQAYFTQNRDGSVRLNEMPVMAEVAKFCRARQAASHRAKPVPQVALLYSTAGHYRRSGGLFSPGDLAPLRGVLRALLESQQSVEVLSEHHLTGRLSGYPLVVVPDWDYLEAPFRDELIAYAREGGNLLLVGPRPVSLFQEQLDVKLGADPLPNAELTLISATGKSKFKAPASRVTLGQRARAVGQLRSSDNGTSPAASVSSFGHGKVAGVYFDFGRGYPLAGDAILRDSLASVVRDLFPEPIVEVTGSHDVDVVVARKDGKLLVHLVNTAGPHADAATPVFDNIPPVRDLALAIRHGNKPEKVTRVPGGLPLAFEYSDGRVRFGLGQLDIHDIIVVE